MGDPSERETLVSFFPTCLIWGNNNNVQNACHALSHFNHAIIIPTFQMQGLWHRENIFVKITQSINGRAKI